MIERIASDLGIQKYDSEELARYRCRLIYSSISCWIKTVALDRPIINDDDVSGVSRRHLLERCHLVLDKLIEIFPETSGWFYPDDREDDPVALIRTRLLNHGDLLNSGYETKLALSSYLVMPISASIDVVYGKTLEKGLVYSGISTIRYNENANLGTIRLALNKIPAYYEKIIEKSNIRHKYIITNKYKCNFKKFVGIMRSFEWSTTILGLESNELQFEIDSKLEFVYDKYKNFKHYSSTVLFSNMIENNTIIFEILVALFKATIYRVKGEEKDFSDFIK